MSIIKQIFLEGFNNNFSLILDQLQSEKICFMQPKILFSPEQRKIGKFRFVYKCYLFPPCNGISKRH